jgi:hypothetical protein
MTEPMSETEAHAVALALTVIREILRETPDLYRKMEDVVLADTSFMAGVPNDVLMQILETKGEGKRGGC